MPVGDIRWLILALVCAAIVTILNWPEIRAALFRRRNKSKKADSAAAVDYLGAQAIIDAYIGPALVDKREGVRLVIRQDIMRRFDRVTGAKLGEFEYNRALLQEWLESNAARFLVDNRQDLA